jgi:type IV pilus assembly protein PilV
MFFKRRNILLYFELKKHEQRRQRAKRPLISPSLRIKAMSKNSACLAPRRGKSSPAGFTLIEVLVTVVVIAVGCLAALWMQSVAMRGHAQSDHLTMAAVLAETELERLKSLTFQDLTAEAERAGGSVTRRLNRLGREEEPTPYTLTTRYLKEQPTKLSHQVEVSVGWRDTQGVARTLRYTAVLTSFSLSPN